MNCFLETERLYLRRFTPEDFDALKTIISDKETMAYYDAPYDDAGVKRWIDWNLSNYEDWGFGLFVLINKNSGAFIGDCGITVQRINGKYRPEVGYHIHKSFWRQGYAKEAATAIRDWAFGHTPIETLYSYTVKENKASIATARSIGMEVVEEYIDTDGASVTVSAISREKWKKIKG